MKIHGFDEKSIFAAKVGAADWYRIPHHMVGIFLGNGAAVKELPLGGAWRSVTGGATTRSAE